MIFGKLVQVLYHIAYDGRLVDKIKHCMTYNKRHRHTTTVIVSFQMGSGIYKRVFKYSIIMKYAEIMN